jgi:hypothetical protein
MLPWYHLNSPQITVGALVTPAITGVRCNGLPVPVYSLWGCDLWEYIQPTRVSSALKSGRLSLLGICGGSQPETTPSLSVPLPPTPPRESRLCSLIFRIIIS